MKSRMRAGHHPQAAAQQLREQPKNALLSSADAQDGIAHTDFGYYRLRILLPKDAAPSPKFPLLLSYDKAARMWKCKDKFLFSIHGGPLTERPA